LTVIVSMLLKCSSLRQAFKTLPFGNKQHAAYSSFSQLNARLPANSASLDTNLLATNPELVISHLQSRKSNSGLLNDVSTIATLRGERNALIVTGDAAKSVRKNLSQQIGQLMKAGKSEEVVELKKQVETASEASAAADIELDVIDAKINKLFSVLPNLLDDSVPEGSDEASNTIVLTWGDEKRKMGEGFQWHDEIATKLGGLDVDAAARISGARFSVLKGPIARLERALISYFLDFHTSRGYEEISVPFIVSRSTLEGTGQLPKFEDDLFKVSHSVSGEDAFLIPTAEVPVTNLYRDQVLDAASLPVMHVCCSPSFRAEAGSYGRDTRGLLRQHQFHKVELVKIVSPESSTAEHEKMCNDAEDVLKSLDLPYRKVLLCSGDIGFSARICYDLEVWLPGQQAYREISSVSNCYDFQARRMGLR
jgi:seryl-tRNA synthetase